MNELKEFFEEFFEEFAEGGLLALFLSAFIIGVICIIKFGIMFL